MALFDSAELLTSIKTRGMVPANAGSWTDDELLRAATEEILTWHLPLLVAAKGEYLVKDEFLALLSTDNAFPAAAYDISYRAAAVRHVKYVTGLVTDANGTTTAGQESPMEELTPPEQASFSLQRVTRGVPRWFTFREGKIEVYPAPNTPSGQASLWVKWHMRPSRLTLTTNCRLITNVQADTPTAGKTRITLTSAIPSALAGAIGTLYDFVSARNPFPVKAWDVATTTTMTGGVSTTMDVLSTSLRQAGGGSAGVAIGDYLCPAEKTLFPNIPSELHSAAALRAAATAVSARNPALKERLMAEAYAKEISLLNGILAPRSKGNVKRLVNRRW